MARNSTLIIKYIKAPRQKIYRALLDPEAIARWKVPTGMNMRIHEFNGREGGAFRISLTYTSGVGRGKTTAHTDTYHGRFVKLVPNKQVVEEDEFETSDPSLQGLMTATITLEDADEGTKVTGLHEGLPKGVSLTDNEEGWRITFDRLAELVETP